MKMPGRQVTFIQIFGWQEILLISKNSTKVRYNYVTILNENGGSNG